ncbi:GxxExxY protein [Thiohalophilus sp.]|uniref:GxxExxY protein n=1 Tax=Thiohalophilus sp. TaxID=3028392 RepID=UPI002ACED4FB|nr:GxxExxY protein [Thiohalophilus sp.]MDZ7661921.1 GxxExxY protein [Thiohalophilus sp.]MDZ7803788.1 GxxExxY protein [Thiohalophilus sp.]
MEFIKVSSEVDKIAKEVVDSAFHVHKSLGPGLLESVYEACMLHELQKRGMKVESQKTISVIYDGLKIDAGLRLDLLVEDEVVVELKSVETILPVHDSQLLSYLKLANKRLGLLINFNVPVIKDGIRRRIL